MANFWIVKILSRGHLSPAFTEFNFFNLPLGWFEKIFIVFHLLHSGAQRVIPLISDLQLACWLFASLFFSDIYFWTFLTSGNFVEI